MHYYHLVNHILCNVYRNDVFGSTLMQQPAQKKKPPPRPPPPRFNQNYAQTQKEKLKKPVSEKMDVLLVDTKLCVVKLELF